MDDKELRRVAEKYAEQVARMASEAGQVLDRTMTAMDASARQAYEEIAREARPHTEEMKKLAKDIAGEVKNDIPKVRNELRELENKAKQKLQELRGK